MLIKDVFEEFLSEQKSRLSPKTYRGYASVIELFEHQLDGYGVLRLAQCVRPADVSKRQNRRVACRCIR
jgi:hypothetical protein